MIKIQLSLDSQTPFYKQIVEQVKLLIETQCLKPGDKMPTVRELSRYLQVNPTTIARSYQELEQEGLLHAKCRGGTKILEKSSILTQKTSRQNRLASKIDECILRALSLGYTPDELESAFKLQLENKGNSYPDYDSSLNIQRANNINAINIIGSNDLALDLLINHLRYRHPEVLFQITPAGSTGGLVAILEGKADLAGTHLLDEDTGEYNLPFIKHTLQDVKVVVIHLVDRVQGLMVAKGNPKNIKSLEDLGRPDIHFMNRQKGSGTRVLLDYKLKELGIITNEIKGYSNEKDTHMAVAMSIINGNADVGLGIQSAAISCGLEFIPSVKERFDLVIPADKYHSRIFTDLMEMIRSQEFKRIVDAMGGYDTAQTGDIIFEK